MSNDPTWAALADALRARGEIELPAAGTSMGRRWRDADSLRIRTGRARIGDVVVFERGRRWVAHRLIAVRGRGKDRRLIVKGDGETVCDVPYLRDEEVLGIVAGVRRGGELERLEGVRARMSGWASALAGLARAGVRRMGAARRRRGGPDVRRG